MGKGIYSSLLAIILVLLLLPSVYALALRGNHLSPIIFEPGKKIVNHYIIDGTDKQVTITLGGELLEYVRVTEVVNNEFDLIIEVPETLPEPGEYWFSLHATEGGSSEASGVSSLVSVNLRFQVEVPPYGKAISLSFDVPDVNVHQPIPFSVTVTSKGLEDITSVKGSITVYNLENEYVAFLTLKEKPLPALSSVSLSTSLPPDKLSAGKYWAEAVIPYDGEEKRAKDQFKIGNLDLLLINYSTYLEREFGDFWAIVENNWGNPIQNAYAVVSLNGTELLTTPTISLGPWQRDTLKGILRTDFSPGNVTGSIQLFYDNLSKTENMVFTIFEPEMEDERSQLIAFALMAGVSLFILLGLIVVYIFIKTRSIPPF